MSPKNSKYFTEIFSKIINNNFSKLLNISNCFYKKTLVILLLLFSTNCNSDKKYDKTKAFPALELVSDIKIDDSLKNTEMKSLSACLYFSFSFSEI